MDQKSPSYDNYFASIKRLLIPFVILNIVAVILGTSTVNMVNLLDIFSTSTPAGTNPQSSAVRSIHGSPVHDESTSHPEPALNNTQQSIFEQPSSTSNFSLSLLATKLSDAQFPLSPENEISPRLPKHENESIYDKVSNFFKEDTDIVIPNIGLNQANEVMGQRENLEKEIKSEVRQLILPTIDIKAPIINIPIVDRNWDISKLDDNVGILGGFSSGPEEPGALVVAAHATTEWPTAGPFAELRLMNLGDPIVFQNGNTEYVYEISRFLRIDTSNVNILHKNGDEGIVLVTCGSYNYFTGEYGSRLVAYGDLIETRPIQSNSNKDPIAKN